MTVGLNDFSGRKKHSAMQRCTGWLLSTPENQSMLQYRYLTLGFAFFICLSCRKNNSQNYVTNPLLAPLIGSWNWVIQHNNGIYSGNFTGNPFGDTLTPANTGISETLRFYANGEWTLLQNGVRVSSGIYKIKTALTPGGPVNMLDIVKAGESDSLVNHVVYKDTLTISNPRIVTVGFNRVYVRL